MNCMRTIWCWLIWRAKKLRSAWLAWRCRRSQDCMLDMDLSVGVACGVFYCSTHGTVRLITDALEIEALRGQIYAHYCRGAK